MSAQLAHVPTASAQPQRAAVAPSPRASLTAQRCSRRVSIQPTYGRGRCGVEVSYL